MIYLKLFLIFLEIGAVSFGGGYGMISIIREKVLTFGWLSEDEFVNFIAVSESTPGPLAVNMATFVGSSQAGFIGGLIATLGVVAFVRDNIHHSFDHERFAEILRGKSNAFRHSSLRCCNDTRHWHYNGFIFTAKYHHHKFKACF